MARIPAAATVIIEDTEAGIVAGHRAGARVVALLDPRFGDGALAASKTAAFYESGADAGCDEEPDCCRETNRAAWTRQTTEAKTVIPQAQRSIPTTSGEVAPDLMSSMSRRRCVSSTKPMLPANRFRP
jgi:hypothetical protein